MHRHENEEALLLAEALNCLRDALLGNASGEAQHMDTHVNSPYKTWMRSLYPAYNQDFITDLLMEKCDGDELDEVVKQIADGKDPKEFAAWIPPEDVAMPVPSRGKVILWGRIAREQFDTPRGRDIMRDAFYSNGLVPNENGEYLMYSARKANEAAAEAESKKRKAAGADGGKEAAEESVDVIAKMMLSFSGDN